MIPYSAYHAGSTTPASKPAAKPARKPASHRAPAPAPAPQQKVKPTRGRAAA